MSRITLAFSCFFRLLFGGRLPARALEYIPEEAIAKALPAPKSEVKAAEKKPSTEKAVAPAAKPARSSSAAEQHREGALAMLGLLQREGRLIDFLNESLDDYEDADIGAAVRDIHRGCKKVLDDYLDIEPVMPGEEEDKLTVPAGFDAAEIRLVGEVSGDPPFKGTLRHHGWRVTKTTLPTLSEGVDRRVLAPAEVEVG
jgi:hypothetical protein